MSLEGLVCFEQHFLFSNRIFQFLIRIRPNQSSNEQLILLCAVLVFVLPLILHQIKLLLAHVKIDYILAKDENELKIIEKYTKESKWYASILIVIINLFIIAIIFPSISKVFMYFFGTLNDTHLTLPCPINNVLYAGWLYYNLLIYQIIGFFIMMTIIVAFSSLCWVILQHACGQFGVMILKIRQPFESDQIRTKKVSLRRTLQEEYNWIVDIIKCYTRITKYIIIANNIFKEIYFIAIFISMIILFELTVILCNIPFYNLSIKTQKMLLFLLTRCIKPIEFSIGGIFIASHVVFAALVQKAFSFAMVYYTVLQI
ncbi:uncharacterized protein LOC124953536 [Vespa velutina]|uniref:uncharacterized protein LOC124953536 n=1 Tax=Vespa velutina TaxID=202808 RepID=UPI001FB1CDA2|nr:uncharacterized protein LOC124953536 [Vespa velutina]